MAGRAKQRVDRNVKSRPIKGRSRSQYGSADEVKPRREIALRGLFWGRAGIALEALLALLAAGDWRRRGLDSRFDPPGAGAIGGRPLHPPFAASPYWRILLWPLAARQMEYGRWAGGCQACFRISIHAPAWDATNKPYMVGRSRSSAFASCAFSTISAQTSFSGRLQSASASKMSASIS